MMNEIKQPVNVYGITSYYERGLLEEVYDGFGYCDKDGNITWYDGYEPKEDESHTTSIAPYGNGANFSDILKSLSKPQFTK
jgi:predicted NodU family carbamoyl transferase